MGNLKKRMLLLSFAKIRKSFFGDLKVYNTSKCYLSSNTTRPVKSFDEIPGPKSYPFFGSILSFKGMGGDLDFMNMNELSHQLQQRYGDIVKMTIFGENYVYLFNPDYVKKIFQADGEIPLRRGLDALGKYFDIKGYPHTLVNSNLNRWKTLRSVTNPIVGNPRSVRLFMKQHNQIASDFVKYINKKFENESNTLIYENFDEKLKMYALELISVVAFDNRIHCVDEKKVNKDASELINTIDTFFLTLGELTFGLPLWKLYPTKTWKTFVNACDIVFGAARKYVEEAYEKVKELTEDERKNMDSRTILQQYLLNQEKYGLTLEDIITMTADFVFAGIDTTSTTLHYALYELAQNHRIQEDFYEEIKSVVKNSENVTEEHLARMPFLKAIMKETLRVHSVAPALTRVLKEDLIIENYHIPKGTNIFMGVMYITKSERFFNNPKVFEPKRWIKGHKEYQDIHPYSNLPFGFGARQCIGRRIAEQELCLSLIKIFQKFKLEYTGEKIGYRVRLVAAPDKPLNLRISRRQFE